MPRRIELKPCKRCGSNELVMDHYSVMCAVCLAEGPRLSGDEVRLCGGYNEKCYDLAAEKWNRQAAESVVVAEQPPTGSAVPTERQSAGVSRNVGVHYKGGD